MKRPTTLKSVKIVFTFIKNIVSEMEKHFEKLNNSFERKQVLQPLFLKTIKNKTNMVLVFLMFLCFNTVTAQLGQPFLPRLTNGNVKVKGDILLIGNTIVNKVNNRPYTGNNPPANYDENPADFSPSKPVAGATFNGTVTNLAALTTQANLPFNALGDNNDYYIEYVDVDGDASTYNSSSADLVINNSCKSIVFAGLYWSAIYPYERSTKTTTKYDGSLRYEDWNTVKFKMPGGVYETLTASKTDTKEVIFNGYAKNGTTVYNSFKDSPYVCFKDVTTKLQSLANANGTYTVADMRAARGKRDGGGAGGWTLVVIYESPSLPSKFISVFDGYAGVNPDGTPATGQLLKVDFNVSGFKTLPAPFPVYAKIGVGALEGDNKKVGDYFQFKGNNPASLNYIINNTGTVGLATNPPSPNDGNPADNFFNASITKGGNNVTARNPNGWNSMGFDIDDVDIKNTSNNIVKNDETGATLTLGTTSDGYGAFLTTFAVDIIEPKIVLTKIVKGVNTDGTVYDLNGAPVNLDQELRYVIGFQNQGNDDAQNFTITDVLPQNVYFNWTSPTSTPNDVLFLPTGVTVKSYVPATRTIVFEIDKNLVKAKENGGAGTYEIIFRVKVVKDCNDLVDACSNEIKNTAISRYNGVKNFDNNGVPFGDGSFSFNTGCLVGDPTSTNFLVGVDQCLFSRNVSLCGSALLKAANGYTTYEWKDQNGVVVGNTQQITVTKAGTYKVQTGGNPNCKGIVQTYIVTDYVVGANDNPISQYANNIDPVTSKPYTCTNDGKEFPKIFLCGLNDTRVLDTKITAAGTTITWQITTDVPPSGFPARCAYEEAVNWTTIANGPIYTANKAGAYRVIVNYGNNCQNTFYFSVFQNPLDPKFDKQDIICNTVGKITITNPLPNSGYTYSLDNGAPQPSNIFDNVAEGNHVVNIIQAPAPDQTSTCPFKVDVTILKLTFSGKADTIDPLCPGDKGTITLTANNVPGYYNFTIKNAGTNTVVASSGQITFPNYFSTNGLNPGKYDVSISTKDGCVFNQTVEIFDKILKAPFDLKTLSCEDGSITIKATGGTPIPGPTPTYYYSVNGALPVTNPVIPVTRPLPDGGIFNIVVTDYAGCKVTIPTITMTDAPKPTVTFNPTHIKCYGGNDGKIDVVISPATSGYAVSYSVNNGVYSSISPITNLIKGDYSIVVKYTYNGIDCFDPPVIVKITEPSTAVTASAGVSELAGCDPSGNGNGKLRITNPQGGTPGTIGTGYEYSFDGGVSWQTSNEKYVTPGTYNLYIRDSKGCSFPMPGIVLDNEPVPPSINVNTPVSFNCDGTATSTVIVNNPGPANYTYKYYLDNSTTPNTNTPPNVFLNVPSGSHTVHVEYTLVSVPTFSNLLNEDFGQGGNVKTPGIASAYCYHDVDVSPSTCPNDLRPTLEDGQYVVTRGLGANNNSAWYLFKDHTSNGTNPIGRYLAVNIGGAAGPNGVLYSKTINDVIPNQPVIVEAYLANLFRANFVGGVDPSFAFELVDMFGNVVAQEPKIPPAPNPTGIPAIPTILRSNNWEKRTVTLNPGNNTTLIFRVRSGSTEYSGNDAAIDDIKVYQLPKSCKKIVDIPLTVPTGKAFAGTATTTKDVTCEGANDGQITITATNFDAANGYDYSIDGGLNWINTKNATEIVKNLPAKLYDIRIRYDAVSGPTCTKSFSPTIKSPKAIIVGAVVFIPAKCSVGATIRVTATEGTPAYEYKLVEDITGVVIKDWQPSRDFIDVKAGNYLVFVRDANKCSNPTGVAIKVDASPALTAVLDASSDLCFDAINQASLIVTAGGGTPPYSYILDTRPAQDSNPVFTNVGVGPHKIVVTDAAGCAAPEINITIEPQVTSTIAVKALTCDPVTGNAVISGTISNGYAPYTVTKFSGPGPGTFVQPNVANLNTFTYTTAVAGTYVFDITDAKGCNIQKSAIINTITNPSITILNQVNVTCKGLLNGSVVLQGNNGSGGYTFSDNATTGFTNVATFPGLAEGLHTFYVKDSNGCTGQIDVTITAPATLTGSASITTPYTCIGTGATITAIVTTGAGTSPYTFILKRGTTTVATNTTGIFNNLTVAGTYTVEITDSKSCPLIVSAGTIVALTPPTAMTFSNSALKCPSNKVDVTIETVTGGKGTMATFQYRITLPAANATAYQGSPIFTNLDPGTYTFEVKDENECTKTAIYKIDQLPVIGITSSVVNNVICKGESNGSVKFTVTGFGNNTPYSYTVDALPTQTGLFTPVTGTSFDIIVTGLNQGNHSIVVRNETTNCTVTKAQNVTEAPIAFSITPATVTPVTCNNLGTALINVTGGWGNNTYTVTPLAPLAGPVMVQINDPKFLNLADGNYSVSVSDLNGCIVTGAFTIAAKTPIIASIDPVSVYCAGGVGATLSVTPNTQTNYTYSINGSTPKANGTFSGLTPGKYIITVTDTSTGCSVPLPEEVIASPLTASTTLLADLDCDVLPASPDASIQVTINDGYPGYSYKVNKDTAAPFNGAVTTLGAGVNVFTYPAATAGTYYFEITDSKGCKTVVSRTINAKVDPTATTTPTNPTCFNGTNGSITVNASLGLAPYTYEVSTTSATGPFVAMASNIYSNAGAGNYWFRVTDSKKCPFVVPTTLNNPAQLTATAAVTKPLTCGVGNASQAATITVTVVLPGTPYSGANPYRYSYNGLAPVTSNTYSINTPGPVSVIVYDGNGCSYPVPTSPVVDVLNPPSALAYAQANPITCDTAELDSDLTVTVTNGTAPYKFEITSTDAAVAPAAPVATGIATQSHTFVNLAPGTYYFKITDANNCTITGNYKIDNSVPVQVTGSPVANVTCNAGTDGSIKFTVTNTATVGTIVPVLTKGGVTVTPALSITGNVYQYTGLTAGTYIFTATNNVTKCFATSSVSISEPAAITGLTATASKVYACMALPKMTTIKVSASGGASPLYYAVVKLGVAPVFPTDYNTTGIFTKDTGVDGLVYDAYVVDKNGNCPQKLTPVNVVNDPAPTIQPVAAQCYSGSPFTITIVGTVFPGSSIQYGINGVYTTNPVKTIPGAGTYNLTVKDDNGCISPVEIYNVIDQLTISAILNKDITCITTPPTATAAQITLSAGGGNNTYAYEYRLAPSITYNSIPGNVFNPTAAGDYYFRVTSGGCSVESTAPVKVTTPINPVITGVTQTQFIKCSGDETAAIKIDIDNTKGVPTFVYKVESYTDNTYTAPVLKNYGTQTTGLPAGFYRVTVTDDKGCTDTEDITILGKDPIDFDLSKIDIQCTTGTYTLGSITVKDVVGGTAPFKYFISNNYGDAITPPNPYIAAGSENYTFNSIINFGIYTINVVDANGCSLSKKITMTSPPSDLEVIIDTSAPNCTDGTATVTVKASPLGSNYTFGIFETNVPPFSSNFVTPNNGIDSHIFTGLTPGVLYTFVVHDGDTGCDFVNSANIAIPAASTLVPVITPHNVTCIGEDDGYVSFEISGYNPLATSIDYQVFAALSNADISGVLTYTIGDPTPVNYPALPPLPAPQVGNLVPGQYYIVFTEKGGPKDGCKIASQVFDIKESSIDLSVIASIFKNENCKDLGIITAEAKDGTGPYEYLVNTTNTTPVPTTSGWQPENTFNLAAGTYYVFAKDANGCIKPATQVILVKDPDPVFVLTVPNKCATQGNFIVDVTITDPTPSMAPYSISVNNGAFENFSGLTYSATGLNSGTQTVIIQNKNGCPITHTIDINPTPQATAEVTKVLNCSGIPNAVVDATIKVTITKGTSPYTIEVKKGSGAYTTISPTINVVAGVTTFDYTVADVDADTYQFQITDSNTCSVETNPVVIDPIIPIIPAFNAIQPLCNGGTGTIELSAAGGKGPYTYNFNNSGFSGQTIYSVTQGTYPFIVKDNLGCEATGSAILGEPGPVAVGTPIISPLTCGPGNVGLSATVDLSAVASGGTGAFLYSFNGSAFDTKTVYTVDDNDADQLNILFAVQDANGCEASGTVDIFKLNPPTNFDMTPSAVITCSTTAINVTISNVINAVGPVTTGLTYQIISPTFVQNNNNPVFTNLAPGNYVFQVTDGTNCVKQLPYEIIDVTKIDIAEQSTTGITCLSASDGKASFLVSGFGTGAGTYHYILDATPSVTGLTSPTIDLTGLASGAHTITVYDDETGCFKPLNFNIAAPALALAISKVVTPLGCTTFGAVTITAVNGWGNYKYTLIPPVGPTVTNIDGVFGDLSDITGPYTVSVTDANGCTLTDTFTLTTPVNPIAAIDLTSDYCYDNTNQSTLVVTASLGVAPYFFSIDNGVTFSPSNTLPTPDNKYTFSNLSPGSYDILVQDAYGCKSIVPVNTLIKPQLFATAQNTKDIFCTGVTSGTITISAVGGYGDYTYTVTKDANPTSAPIVFPVGSDTADYSVTGPGSYVIVVSDARNCSYTVTNSIIMVDPTPVAYTVDPTSPSCTGTQGELSDGSILITLDAASVDNPDYTYTVVSNPPGYTKTQVNNGLFTGLAAGDYNIMVTSARGCSTPDTVTIATPVLVVASASASPFKCTGNAINETIVIVTATGGAGTNLVSDYTYSENGTDWKTDNTFTVIDGPTTQNPVYYVRDANGCIDDVTIPITAFPKLTAPTVTFGPLIDCINNKQEINVVINGGSSIPNAFTYNVYKDGVLENPAPIVVGNSFTYDALSAGSFYEFEIIDNNTGCSIKSVAYEVPLFNTAKLTASVSSNVDCNTNATGGIEINIDGYSGSYNYEIFKGGVTTGFSGSGNTTSNPFVLPHGLVAGVYNVVVTQTAYPSCILTSADVEITEPDALSGFTVTNVNKNCNNSGSTVTVDVSSIVGGTPGYTYAFVQNNVDPTGHYFDDNFAVLDPAVNTEWDVWVMDSHNCPFKVDVTIAEDVSPSGLSVNAFSQCPSLTGQYTFTVSATTVAGAVEYSIGAGFQSSGTFTVDAPGVYPVTIRDKNGCPNLLPFNVTILDPIVPSATIKLPKCNDADGEITVTAIGGNGPANFEYSIDGTNYGPLNIFPGLAPNTYRLYVRDKLSGCVKFIDEKIDPAAIITDFELKQTPVTCFGFTDGTITATMAIPSVGINDNPKYMYSLDGGIPQESNVFTNLATGHYKVVVTSARGCEAEAEIDVESPLIITVPAPAVTQFSCAAGTNAGDFATITVSGVTGGSNSFANYEFIKVGTPTPVYFGSEPTFTVYDKTGGFYIVNVYDSNGCVGTAPAQIEIKAFIELDKITVNVDNAITCANLEDITVSVSTIGGAATNLQYTVVDVDATTGTKGTLYPMQTQLNNGVFTGLPVANYLITVTNLDTNCSIEYIHYVNSPKTFDLTLDNVKDVSCFGGTNGSVDVTFVDLLISTNPLNADQAGPFRYDVTDSLGNIVASVVNTGSAGPITIPNLAAGVYTIKATLVNTPFCDVTENFTIAQPSAALDITEQHEEITCVTGDGKIEVTATGGWPGVYQYELRIGAAIIKPFNDSPVFDNLVEGNYTVYVTDGKCEDFIDVPLTNPIPISATIIADKTAVLCYDDATATITVNTISGGSGNYAYTLHGTLVDNTTVTIGAQPENIFTNLAAGTYYVTVSDDWTCNATTNTVSIGEPDKMEVSLEHGIEETCDITPTVILRATGGTGPYFYSVDGTNYNPASFVSFVEIPLPATTADVEYQYYVKDSNNCTSVLSNKVPYSPVPELKFETLNAYDIKCTGSANGAITAVAIGGLGNYIYVLADATGVDITPAPTQLSPGEFTGLAAGKYIVKVNSVDCDTSGIIEILEPGTAVNAVATPTNIKCAGSDNGTITIVASGGVPGYTYAITPELEQFFDVPVFENLKPGPYTVRIQDANGCYIDRPVTITEPDPLFAKDLPNLNVPEYCTGDKDGIIYVEVTLNSGTAPYKASIDNGPLVDPDPADIEGNNFIFTGLTGGEHSIDVFDANGCRYPLTSTLPDAITLNPSAEVDYTCEGDNPVSSIVVSVDPSITEAQKANIIYTVVETGVTQVGNNVFKNLPPGDYTVRVELDGCQRTTSPAVTVKPVDKVVLTLSDTEMNVINASATGGVGNYQYSFNGEDFTTSNRYKIYKTGEYEVIVIDENGCTDTKKQTFTYVDVCLDNYFTPEGSTNTLWGPGCTNIYTNLEYSIFDRYGRVIAKYHYGQKWDGRYNGEALPSGDYWYVLKLNDPKDQREFVGHFTLYR